MVSTVVWACDSQPLLWWPLSVAWLLLLALLGFLMVSTWRYHSFKGISFSKAYSPLIIILVAGFMYGVVNYAQLLLLTLATAYVASGIVIRIGGILRRRLKPAHHAPEIKIA
jgi:CDP-diacylglycerol--serine O-phosphatidyltransferase